MNPTERGTIINLNAYGATVRLEDGRLASAPQALIGLLQGHNFGKQLVKLI